MSPMTLSEKTATRTYGLLASRVSETLGSVLRTGQPPRPEERELLSNGESLLEQFIVGSRLVEGDKFRKDELAPRPDAIKAFRHALFTLQVLQRVGADEKVTTTLREIRKALAEIRQAHSMDQIDQERAVSVASFFTALASLLCDDLARTKLEDGAPQRSTNSVTPGGTTSRVF